MAKFVVGMMDKHDEFYETSKTYSNEYKIEYKENKRNVPLKLLHYKGNEEINNPYVVVHHGTIDNTNVIAFSDAIFGWIKDRNTILIVNSINKTASEHIITRMARHDKNIIFFTTHNAESVDFVSNFYKKKVILLADKRLSVDIIGDIDSFSNKGIISGKVQMETASKKIDELKEEISKGHNDHRADIIRKEINDYMGRIYKIYLKSNSYNFEGQNDKFLDVVNDIINLRKSKYKVVHGGGVAFKDAANYILSFKNNETSKEKLLAVDIVSTALYAPINELLARSYTKTNYSDYPDIGIGYNAHGKEKCSMINSGIITPLVSFVNTINIAKDIATEWLLTDASIVVEYNNKEEE
jgi:chaperonin GroEL (HSP60 family)